jgi:hypothetical protein
MSNTYITNECKINANFKVEIASDIGNKNCGDDTWLIAAPGVSGDYAGKTIVYLSTNGDPVIIGTWGDDDENVWSIFDEESAEDGDNTAEFLLINYSIDCAADIEELLASACKWTR